MQARFASPILVMLGLLDLALLNFVLVPRLNKQGIVVAHERPAAAVLSAGASRDASTVVLSAVATPTPQEPSDSAHKERSLAVESNQAAPDIEFEFGTERIISPSARADLVRVAGELRAAPTKHLVLRGHADRLGSRRHNYELGRRRAQVILRLLMVAGSPSDRVSIESVGDREPADRADTPIAWARNRRVQLLWR